MRLLRFLLVGVTVLLAACASNQSTEPGHTQHHPIKSSHAPNASYSVWDRIKDGFSLKDLNDDQTKQWIEYYSNRPDYVQRMAARSSKYIYHIIQEVESRDFPSEIALLPFVESAYNANALSSAKAAGLWQFVPSTGRNYNLRQDFWSDHRLNPVHATRAALDYLGYLYDYQGKDWNLALASYNWGEGAVARARASNESKGLPTDYLSLNMPKETRNYVPKLLAIKEIISNPEKYNITLPFIPNTPYFEEVTNSKDIDVKVMAKLANMSEDEFKELNPSFKRPVLLANKDNSILLPVSKVKTYKNNLKNYDGELSTWKGYQAEQGETIKSIAQKFNLSASKLKTLNEVGANENLADRTILIPTSINVENFAPSLDVQDIKVSKRRALAKVITSQFKNSNYKSHRGIKLANVETSNNAAYAKKVSYKNTSNVIKENKANGAKTKFSKAKLHK